MRLRRLVDGTEANTLGARARARRFAFFMELMNPLPAPVRVLDVGGTSAFWALMAPLSQRIEVTILNLALSSNAGMNEIVGDARSIPELSDNAFDVVFSNSVIEHVGGREDQEAMAREIRRVGQRHFIQTPNRWFPLEPHFLLPGFQFLPTVVRARLLQRFDLGHIGRERTYADAKRTVRSIRLLGAGDMRRLFPDSTLHRERVLGLTKSLMAVGGWS